MPRVLIVDDEPWSRQVVKSLGAWESLQLTVAGEAEDGTEALRLLAELKPEIVVTDMRMPGLDGVELLKAMRERFPALQIIVMSGYDDFLYLKQAIRSQAVDYLLKPIDQAELNAALGRAAQELARAHEEATGPVFHDTATLERYLDHRQQISTCLLALNSSAVLQSFGKLAEFLDNATTDADVRPRVRHDLLLILQDFAVENEVDLARLMNENADLGSCFAAAVDAAVTLRRSRNRLDLKEVQAHIERHFADPISLETIAQRFFVSKEHLSRTFKTFARENISDYILRKRMEKARELIVEQGLAIKHVAQITGYPDLAYFYRVFKKHFGVTPGELRGDD